MFPQLFGSEGTLEKRILARDLSLPSHPIPYYPIQYTYSATVPHPESDFDDNIYDAGGNLAEQIIGLIPLCCIMLCCNMFVSVSQEKGSVASIIEQQQRKS